MQSGIKIRDLIVGDGAVAERSSGVVVHIRGYLHHGDECCNTYAAGAPLHISLSKRDHLAGLRKGIEGMRVGGRRDLIVSPHLAYGKTGAPPLIPPNAVIRFEVELIEVESPSQQITQQWPLGRQLLVFRPGEAARNLPRWQFGLTENKGAGVTITYPVPGLTWRYARIKQVNIEFAPSESAQILESAQETFSKHKIDCLTNDDLWADASEKANSITRDRRTNSLCVTIQIWEPGRPALNYALPEGSPILDGSLFYRAISQKLAPQLGPQNKAG